MVKGAEKSDDCARKIRRKPTVYVNGTKRKRKRRKVTYETRVESRQLLQGDLRSSSGREKQTYENPERESIAEDTRWKETL